VLLGILIFSSCQQNSFNDYQIDRLDDELRYEDNENEGLSDIEFEEQEEADDHRSLPIYISDYEDVNINDFLNSPELSEEDNDRIKNIIVNVLLYIYGFTAEDYLLQWIDEQDLLVDWLAEWEWVTHTNILDHLRQHREFHESSESRLSAVDPYFMMSPLTYIGETNLQIHVIAFIGWTGDLEERGSRTIHEFWFEKVDDVYTLVGIAINR